MSDGVSDAAVAVPNAERAHRPLVMRLTCVRSPAPVNTTKARSRARPGVGPVPRRQADLVGVDPFHVDDAGTEAEVGRGAPPPPSTSTCTSSSAAAAAPAWSGSVTTRATPPSSTSRRHLAARAQEHADGAEAVDGADDGDGRRPGGHEDADVLALADAEGDEAPARRCRCAGWRRRRCGPAPRTGRWCRRGNPSPLVEQHAEGDAAQRSHPLEPGQAGELRRASTVSSAEPGGAAARRPGQRARRFHAQGGGGGDALHQIGGQAGVVLAGLVDVRRAAGGRPRASVPSPARHRSHPATVGQVISVAAEPTTRPKCPTGSSVSRISARGAAASPHGTHAPGERRSRRRRPRSRGAGS